jgi:hypothetical protein
MMFRLFLCMTIFISLSFSSVLFRTIAAQLPTEINNPNMPTEYKPSVELSCQQSTSKQSICQQTPQTSPLLVYPSRVNVSDFIYAKVNDKYGKIQQAILSYSTFKGLSQGQSYLSKANWTNKTMQLIDGNRSNGTWNGTIPAQPQKNTTVFYVVYFKDDLNYTSSKEGGYYYVGDLEVVNVRPILSNPVIVSALIVDYCDVVPSAILQYAITKGPPDIVHPPTTFMTKKMNSTGPGPVLRSRGETQSRCLLRGSPTTYEAKIPIYAKNMGDSVLWFKVISTDSQGNKYSSILNWRTFVDPRVYIKNFNNISIRTVILNPDISNRIAKAEIQLFRRNHIDTSLFIPEIINDLRRTVANVQFKADVPIFIANLDNNTEKSILIKDYRLDMVQGKESEADISSLYGLNENASFSLVGDPESFPFDHYSLNLLFAFPFKNVKLNYTTFFDKSVNSSWNPTYTNSSFNMDKFMNQYRNIDCLLPANNETGFCVILHNPDVRPDWNYLTFLNSHIEFKRNYTTSAIILPVFAIFYLLGAVFILANSDIANRLVLTVGIFALMFTLPQIINSLKNGISIPTVADSLLSLIVFSTIAYTISSVVSSSSVVQRRFPRHYTWADGLVFILVSIIVIISLHNYSPSLRIWLIPVILIGLGYGLVIRISKQKLRILAKRFAELYQKRFGFIQEYFKRE